MLTGDLTWGGEYIVQYTDDMLQNYTPETYIILLTSVTPIHSIRKTTLLIVFPPHSPSAQY